MPKLSRPTYKDKRTGEPRRSACYYVRIRHADGVRRLVRLSPVLAAARVMLAKLIADIEHERANPTTPLAAAAKKPLADHLADWAADLTAAGSGAKHARQSADSCRKVFDGCGAVKLADIAESAVRRFVAEMGEKAAAPALPPPAESGGYTVAELARALEVSSGTVTEALKRRGFLVAGRGRARRVPVAAAEALAADRGSGSSVRTCNFYTSAAKQFCAWCVRDGRLRSNPLAGLKLSDPEGDRRRIYATLSAAELRALIDAARDSAATFHGLTGPDRVALYTLALYTAFRPVEVSRLMPADFRLAGPVPFARLDGSRTKNGQPCDQALPPDVAELMTAYLAGRPAGEPVWPGTWHKRAADMTRVDLAAAGLPCTKPGPDGRTLTVGFYSIRHSAGLLAEANGATVRELMTLMRHSDPKLTLKTYGKLDLAGRAATVAKLPTLADPGAVRPGQIPAAPGHKPGQTPRDEPGRAGNPAAIGAADGASGTPQFVGEKDEPGPAGPGREGAGHGARDRQPLMCVQVAAGAAQEYRDLAQEVIYGGSRVEVGGGRVSGDGSVGAWAAEFVRRYGVVPRGVHGAADLTRYTEARCREFGARGLSADLEALARLYPVRGVANVRTWAEAKAAIRNGYPVAVCSRQGFTMRRDSAGFCAPSGTWNHCMALIGVTESPRPGGFLLNSWGPSAHTGPVGVGNPSPAGFWADAAVLDRMLADGDSWAFSGFTGFPARRLDWYARVPTPPDLKGETR